MILYFKRIIKNKMKISILSELEIQTLIEALLDAIFNGYFSETCLTNLTSCFQDFLNYKIFQQNRKKYFF